MFSTRRGAASLLIGVVIGLMLLKAIVSWLTGSIGILAQASDSLLDIIAGIVTFSAIRIATKPADEEHPYGHGKVEDIAGMVQGLLIFTAAGLIIYAAVRRIMAGSTVELAEAGIGVMLFSIVVSIFLSRHLTKVARATRSAALEANAHNIAADVYSASAVLIGLLIVRLTHISYIDAVLAIGVALYIAMVAYRTANKSVSALVDTKLPAEHETVIKACVAEHHQQIAGFHSLRTRQSGNQLYIDLHLVMNRGISLEGAHEICDRIEIAMESGLHGANVTIHAEPCDGACKQCSAACSETQNQ